MMKITMYELLGMVKDGKAPKRIIYDEYVYELNEDRENYEKEIDPITTLNWDYIIMNCLNEKVEIIEKEKKIPEKIEIYEDEEGHYFIDNHWKKIYITCDEVNFMVEEFNQLIDYLKSKGE